jgi:hypothetical protein
MPSEPSFQSGIFDEPKLVFGGHHTHVDPKTGLALYGPYSLGRDDQVPLRSITVGIVGTSDLIFSMKTWLKDCQGRITNDGREPFWRPAFPGIHAESCFQCSVNFGETWQQSIDANALSKTLELQNYWAQLKNISELYTSAIERMLEREPKPNVIVCITPEEVDASLERLSEQESAVSQPQRTRSNRTRISEPGITDVDVDERISGSAPFNVRRALKAAFMRFEIPTQIVRGSTLGQSLPAGRRHQQDEATKAWNLTAGLYYKAGSHLWRLADIQHGSCYVGVSFYHERFGEKPGMRTSLAQIFTHVGDGLVLRGKSFDWDELQGTSPHLTEELAEELLRNVIRKYTDHAGGSPPTRVVLHKSSRFEKAEYEGFQKALANSIHQWDFVAMEKRDIQFYRQGQRPPVRGTWIRLADRDYILYTRGYIPFFRVYPGMRVPQPLEVIEHFGTSAPDTVLNEILALTKMNWNSADFSCEEPITLNFSRKVGEILALIQKGAPIKEEYRFYM